MASFADWLFKKIGEVARDVARSWPHMGPAWNQPQPPLTPEVEELIRQLGNIQVEFAVIGGRLHVRLFTMQPDGSRHYAQPPPGAGAPPPPPPGRTPSKRRLALKTLGFPAAADPTPEEIRSHYKDLARRLHPDRNPRGEERMKRVNVAYQYLREEWKT